MQKVVKFGGSSLANANQFKKVKQIIESDSKRRIVVVSALGKRNSNDHKITDLLYLTCAHIKYNVDYKSVFNIIKDRFYEIKKDLNLSLDLDKEFFEIESHFNKNIDEEYLVSRGEYLTAKLMAEYLNYTFIDAQNVIYFNYDGELNEDKIKDKVQDILKEYKNIVIPGFYGSFPDNRIHLLSRGGSDVTGSILASASNSFMYENFTDVSGFLVADPKIVKNPKQIKEITYEELRELSYMGANVLHEDTIFPVQELDIPINIKNTNAPNDEGTLILSKCTDNSNLITGIAGKGDYLSLTIIKRQKATKLDVLIPVLEILKKFQINVEHIPSSIDSLSLIIEKNEIKNRLYEVISEINTINDVQDVIVDDDIALIALVGRNMAKRTGISAKIFSILGLNNINIKVIAQASQELSIIVGVENKNLNQAIIAIYNSLVL